MSVCPQGPSGSGPASPSDIDRTEHATPQDSVCLPGPSGSEPASLSDSHSSSASDTEEEVSCFHFVL